MPPCVYLMDCLLINGAGRSGELSILDFIFIYIRMTQIADDIIGLEKLDNFPIVYPIVYGRSVHCAAFLISSPDINNASKHLGFLV